MGRLAVVHGNQRSRDKNRKLVLMSSQEAEIFFWARVEIVEFGCWVWLRGTNRSGYGIMRLNNQHHICQRFAWLLTRGEIPNKLQVLHKCDNPPCVRPDHLFLGTMADNQRDKIEKGRQWRPIGSLNVKAVLSPDDVLRIRSELVSGANRSAIAKKNNVSESTIYRIQSKNIWKSV